INGQMADAYYFCVGGSVGEHAGFGRPIGFRCAAEETPEAIERLLRQYLIERWPGENLRQFFARHSDSELRKFLAGEQVEAVLRDPSPGRPAHELEA
ncbi:MAG TPA: nitrite reductase, partial [Candidatus Angelobacter sp.]